MQSISNTSPAGRLCLAALLIILIAGFSLRFSYNSETLMDNPVRGDAKYYIYYAFNLIEHQVFSKEYNVASPVPDSFWAPGYPVFLAAVMVAADTLGLRFFDLLLFTQLLLGVSTIALTYSLARMCTDKSWSWSGRPGGFIPSFGQHGSLRLDGNAARLSPGIRPHANFSRRKVR